MAIAQQSAASMPDPAVVLAKAVLSASVRLGLNSRRLAGVIGASEASISRLQRGRGIDPAGKEGQLALLLLRLYRSLDALVGGDDARAKAWLWAANDHLAGVPGDRLSDIQGLVDVVEYLDAVRGRL